MSTPADSSADQTFVRRRRSMSAITAPALPILSIALVLIVGLSLFGGRPAAPDVQTAPPEQAQSYLTNLQIESFDAQGQLEYRAAAASAQYFDDEQIALVAVKMDYIGGKEGPWTADAPMGRVPPARDRVLLSGGVAVHGTLDAFESIDFTTEALTLDLSERRLRSSVPVALRAPGQSLQAGGLSAAFDGQSIDLTGGVQTSVAGVQP